MCMCGCVCGCVCVCVSCSVMSDSLRPHGLPPSWLLCPQNSPGKNTGVGCHVLLQGIFHMAGRLFTVWTAREDLFTMLHVKTWSSEQWQQTPRATEKWGLAQETKKQTDWGNQRAHTLRVQNHKEKRRVQCNTMRKHKISKKSSGQGQLKWGTAAAKSLQSCPTLCDARVGSPAGSPVPGILQARTLEWVAISSSNAWKWKVKVKSLSRVRLFMTPWTAAHQPPPSMGFSRQEYWSGVPPPSPKWGTLFLKTSSVKPSNGSLPDTYWP